MGDKLKLKYFIDLIMFVTLLVTALSGLANSYLRMFSKESLIGIDESFWVYGHATFAIITVGLILGHLLLHIDWIKFSSKKIFGQENTEK